jgi:fructokinase
LPRGAWERGNFNPYTILAAKSALQITTVILNNMIMNNFIIFGEVLFDHFPGGMKILGGAPFNVAWHLNAFGQNPQFISRVGNDPEGDLIRSSMQKWGMATGFLQTDLNHPTGQVQISLEHGEPSYHIVEDQAYDHIALPAVIPLYQSGILYHGTLATRASQSNKTLAKLKKLHRGKIFVDVNLRQPWWQKVDVINLIEEADWAKLNSDELTALFGNGGDLQTTMALILALTDLEGIIVTCAEQGALALAKNGKGIVRSVSPVLPIEIVDTVGAGDAFSAVSLLGLSLGWELGLTMERGQAFASAIVGRTGAIVDDLGFYQPFKVAWGLM